MAKSSNFFGLRRGSTKNFTFSVMEGVQITKERVTEVKNPRTAMQMAQRCKLKVCGLAYSAMKSIVDHSFEGVKYGRMSMQRFSSINFPLLLAASKVKNAKFGFAPYGSNSVPMGQYIVSQGSLARPNVGDIDVQVTAEGLKVSLPAADSTYALAGALGVNLGELITLVALVQNTEGDVAFVWCRFHMPTVIEPISSTNVEVESNWSLKTSVSGNVLTAIVKSVDMAINESSAAVFDFIRSAKSSSSWLRSSARLTNVIGTPVYDLQFSEALATYPIGQEKILNNGGNNAVVEGEIAKLTIKAVNTGGEDISTISYKTTGSGSYSPGSTVVATLAKGDGGIFNDATAKLNGEIIAQSPKGTVTFVIEADSTLEWDLKSSDGNMGA